MQLWDTSLCSAVFWRRVNIMYRDYIYPPWVPCSSVRKTWAPSTLVTDPLSLNWALLQWTNVMKFSLLLLSKLHKQYSEYWDSKASLLSDGSLCCQRSNRVWRQPSLSQWALYSTAPYLLLYVNTNSLQKCVMLLLQGMQWEVRQRGGMEDDEKAAPFFSRSNPS